MAETYLSIHEAAAISDKSIQTIRRALKSKKLSAKRHKTPQGFNYLITQDSLEKLYKIKNRSHGSLKRTSTDLSSAEQTSLITEYASKEELGDYKKALDQLIHENQKDKDTFMRFVKVFQDRFTALENQMKMLEGPQKNKKWFHFWK